MNSNSVTDDLKRISFKKSMQMSFLFWVSLACLQKATEAGLTRITALTIPKAFFLFLIIGFAFGAGVCCFLFRPITKIHLRSIMTGILGGGLFSAYFILAYLIDKTLLTTGFLLAPLFFYLIALMKGRAPMDQAYQIGMGLFCIGAFVVLSDLNIRTLALAIALSFLLATFYWASLNGVKIGEDPKYIYLSASITLLVLAIGYSLYCFTTSSGPLLGALGFRSTYLLSLIGTFSGALFAIILSGLVELFKHAHLNPVYLTPVFSLSLYGCIKSFSPLSLWLTSVTLIWAVISILKQSFNIKETEDTLP